MGGHKGLWLASDRHGMAPDGLGRDLDLESPDMVSAETERVCKGPEGNFEGPERIWEGPEKLLEDRGTENL